MPISKAFMLAVGVPKPIGEANITVNLAKDTVSRPRSPHIHTFARVPIPGTECLAEAIPPQAPDPGEQEDGDAVADDTMRSGPIITPSVDLLDVTWMRLRRRLY